MDTDSKDGCLDEIRRFITALAKAHERMVRLRRQLSLLPYAKTATIMTTINHYESLVRVSMDIYVSVDMTDGNIVDWCLEVTVDEEVLRIETDVCLNHISGKTSVQDSVKEFPAQYVHSVEAFEKALESSVAALLAVRSIECSEVRPEDLVILNKLLASLPVNIVV